MWKVFVGDQNVLKKLYRRGSPTPSLFRLFPTQDETRTVGSPLEVSLDRVGLGTFDTTEDPFQIPWCPRTG